MRKLFLFGCSLALFAQIASAQTTVQVVTKTIKKSFDWSEKDQLSLIADMAAITVTTWDEPSINLELKLTAKHVDLNTAKADLEKLQFVSTKLSNTLFIRDYVEIAKSSEKPKSTLKATYVLRVPKNCLMKIDNHFGSVSVIGLRANLDVKSEFCNVSLKDIQGDVKTDAYFGSISTDNIRGSLVINTNRADVNFRHLRGAAAINAEYATVNIAAGEDLVNMNVVAKYSTVNFEDDKNAGYNLSLVAENGKINHPSQMRFKVIKDESKRQATYYASANSPSINISTTFGDINIAKLAP